MIAIPSILAVAAKKAGIKVPEDPDKFLEQKTEFPHFYVFCAIQLGTSMPYPGVHFDNAKVIAEIPDSQIHTITYTELQALGFREGR